MNSTIRLFIKDISDIKADTNLEITNRYLIKDKITYHQINCHSVEKLIELLRYNSEYITEWYDDEPLLMHLPPISLTGNLQHEPLSMHLPPISRQGNLQHEGKYTNDQVYLAEILLNIARNNDVEIFKAFTNIFLNTLPYVCLNHFNRGRGLCITHLVKEILLNKDKSVYVYYIKCLAFKSYDSDNILGTFDLLIQHNQHNGENDEYYDQHIELLRFIESKLEKDDIKDILRDQLDGLQEIIMSNNYKCANLMLEYIHKYYPSKPFPYNLSIAYLIRHNRLDFYDLFMEWYKKDLIKFKSEEMMEVILEEEYDVIDGILLPILFDSLDNTELESLQFLHSKVMKGEFYSESTIQCLIMSSIDLNNREAFAYLINVFPYEAMMLINNDKWIEFDIDTYKPYYRKLLKLKKDFRKYTKKKFE